MRTSDTIIKNPYLGGSLAVPSLVNIEPIRGAEQPVYDPIFNPQPVYNEPINASFPVYTGGIKEQLPIELTPVIEPSQPISSQPVTSQPTLIDLNPIQEQPIKGSGASIVLPADVDTQIGGIIPPKSETTVPALPMPIIGGGVGAGTGAGASEEVKKKLGKNWFWVAVAVGAGIYLISRK